MLPKQRGEGLTGEHRNVSTSDDYVAIEMRHLTERDLNGVAGTELLLLHRDQDMWRNLSEVFFDLITKVADHDHDVFGLHLRRGCHRIAQHGVTRDLVQQLGTRRLHPLALARRQNDDSRDRAGSLLGVNGQQLAPY